MPPLTSRDFQPPAPGRPAAVTALCGVLVSLVAVTLLLALSGGRSVAFGPAYLPYVLGVCSGVGVATWGLWRMRRWGAVSLAVVLAADAAVAWSTSQGNPALTALAAVLAGVGLILGRRMR
jgi:hypothetical protein